jgi:hypothetical protein
MWLMTDVPKALLSLDFTGIPEMMSHGMGDLVAVSLFF